MRVIIHDKSLTNRCICIFHFMSWHGYSILRDWVRNFGNHGSSAFNFRSISPLLNGLGCLHQTNYLQHRPLLESLVLVLAAEVLLWAWCALFAQKLPLAVHKLPTVSFGCRLKARCISCMECRHIDNACCMTMKLWRAWPPTRHAIWVTEGFQSSVFRPPSSLIALSLQWHDVLPLLKSILIRVPNGTLTVSGKVTGPASQHTLLLIVECG